jgi:2-isopropylmalate synthase
MAIKTRPDLMPYDTGINTTLLNKASKIVSNATGFLFNIIKQLLVKMLLLMKQEFIRMEC